MHAVAKNKHIYQLSIVCFPHYAGAESRRQFCSSHTTPFIYLGSCVKVLTSVADAKTTRALASLDGFTDGC